MNKSEKIKYWVEISDYDLETAKAMFKTKRYLYVGFMCHQAVEKILKALFSKSKNATPPYIHNLIRLSEQSGILTELNKSQLSLLDSLQPLNIQARYPSYKEKIYKMLNRKNTTNLLKDTTEFIQWIKKKL